MAEQAEKAEPEPESEPEQEPESEPEQEPESELASLGSVFGGSDWGWSAHYTQQDEDELAKLTLEQLKLRVRNREGEPWLNKWLADYGFKEYAENLKTEGVDSLRVLMDANDDEVDMMAGRVGMPWMKANSFVKSCAEMREELSAELSLIEERIKVLQGNQPTEKPEPEPERLAVGAVGGGHHHKRTKRRRRKNRRKASRRKASKRKSRGRKSRRKAIKRKSRKR